MKWTRGRGTYSNKSDSDIDMWRTQKRNEWENDGLVGTLVMGEGQNWIELQGDENDVDAAMHDLANDSFLDSFQVTDDNNSISDQEIDEIYTYHEDRSPITTA